jgi:isoleucyl-tRNA synthetase
VVNPVGKDGRFHDDLALVGGQFFKDADTALVGDLRERGILHRYEPYTHQYPLCWRCDTALLYYALPSWYIRTTAIRDDMLRENAASTWHPETVRDGRFGEWLRGNVDWALSRNRYWGTPLPIWRCTADASHLDRVASLAELGRKAGRDLTALDPHRPFVDDIVYPCPTCGVEARRVEEVIDCWYDSGAMPFAQEGYPYAPGSIEAVEAAYPAQVIAEGLDQTRGWFYTLLAVGMLAFGRSSYERVLCLGTILDEHGRKMSKHLGNVLDPFELMDRHGADPLRWIMLTNGNPWGPRRIGHDGLAEVTRSFLATYWNTVAFHALYAHANGWDPLAADPPAPADRPVLDRWVLSEAQRLVIDVTDALDSYDPVRAGRRLTSFVDDLSNWYVRRSRRRFWDGDPAALATLHECLHVLTLLLAPFTPFLTEEVWSQVLRAGWPSLPDSVHLASWPEVNRSLLDPELAAGMATVRRLVELGRAARAQSGVRTRQPLGRALVSGGPLPADLLAEVAQELNVVSIEPLAGAADLVDVVVKPNFRLLGKRFGSRTKDVAAQVSAATYADGVCRVEVDGIEEVLSGDELIVTETPREGWAVEAGDGLSVALDLELTDELLAAGLVRDALRQVQQARKDAGLEVSDRIELWWEASDAALAQALRGAGTLLAAEVLAVNVVEGAPAADLAAHGDLQLGLQIWLRAAGG